ncbi:MAG: 50S ribosomal protein L11 methyltransferase, partial [Anaerorhabdus sp.]
MKYIELTIVTTDFGIEEVTASLMGLGINESVVDNPRTAIEQLNKKNDYDWDYVDEDIIDVNADPKIMVYLEDDQLGQAKVKEIQNMILGLKEKEGEFGKEASLGSLELTTSIIDDQDWMNSYKEHFKTIKLTDSIVVKPSWEEDITDENIKVLELDPGMAFGTGDHETTAMCATLMEEYGCAGKEVLDVGTGSGILAIAAALLGGKNILGVDIDPVAVEVAADNVKINNCQSNVTVKFGDLTKGIDFKADIVVANLMAEMVVMLSKAVKNHMKEDAVFISSGILNEKKEMVIEGLHEAGLEIVNVLDRGDWSAIAAK